MYSLLLALLFLSTCLADFPVQTLVSCGISQATIDGVQGVINEHQSMIQLAKTDKRAKKTEVDSMKADIDFYLEENATDDDKVL
uniref:Secreted protein n=1 Tax=Caenorhabditis tropicalis TaxID=1561998 RepID=A0A1I7V1M6_9PELO